MTRRDAQAWQRRRRGHDRGRDGPQRRVAGQQVPQHRACCAWIT